MPDPPALGRIVILNGAPRSGKSSIAAAIQDAFDGPWPNLGVDAYMHGAMPRRYSPGIGLRPGGERPNLEPYVVASFAALYKSIAAHSRQGLNVVAEFGHHDDYSVPRGILPDCARRLRGPAGRRALPHRGHPGAPAGDRLGRKPIGRILRIRGRTLATRSPQARHLRPGGRHLGHAPGGMRPGHPCSPGYGTGAHGVAAPGGHGHGSRVTGPAVAGWLPRTVRCWWCV